MELSPFDKVCAVLSNFNFNTEDLDPSFLCTKCKKIMIDPLISSCGCHYCRRCIEKRRMFCLGNKAECYNTYLEMNQTVREDVDCRQNILNAPVKCPNVSCVHRSKLVDMDEHLSRCTTEYLNCPFEPAGCISDGLTRNNVHQHLTSEVLEHSQLTMDIFHNLKNDVDRLNQMMEIKESVIKTLDLEVKTNKRKINEMTLEGENKRILIERLDDRMRTMEENAGTMRARVSEIETKTEQKFAELKSQISQISKTSLSDSITYKGELMGTKTDSKPKEVINEGTSTKSEPVHGFHWTIREFSKKYGFCQSITFYLENYNLRLKANICNSEQLTLSVIIMNGDNDKIVQWPMRHTITISIIDNDTHKSYKLWNINNQNYRESALFNKPTISEGNQIDCEVIYLDDFPELMSSDSVTVCCSLKL